MFFKKSVDELLRNTSATILANENMASHTTFRIGGAADYYVEVHNLKELKAVLSVAKKCALPVRFIGKGSNLLISDKGINGIVIRLCGSFCNIEAKGNKILAGAGASLASVAIFAKDNGLSGLEFAAGIPGTIGGAVWMNAGAYDGEMSQIVTGVPYLDLQGRLKELKKDSLGFGHRTSIFQSIGYIILGCEMELTHKPKEEIQEKMTDLNNRRREKQPLEFPSAGSTFKRPDGYYAGALIEAAGLKGHTIGGAQVSEKHAGFIINKGNASSKDVVNLIEHIKKTVHEKDGVILTPEVQYWERSDS